MPTQTIEEIDGASILSASPMKPPMPRMMPSQKRALLALYEYGVGRIEYHSRPSLVELHFVINVPMFSKNKGYMRNHEARVVDFPRSGRDFTRNMLKREYIELCGQDRYRLTPIGLALVKRFHVTKHIRMHEMYGRVHNDTFRNDSRHVAHVD